MQLISLLPAPGPVTTLPSEVAMYFNDRSRDGGKIERIGLVLAGSAHARIVESGVVRYGATGAPASPGSASYARATDQFGRLDDIVRAATSLGVQGGAMPDLGLGKPFLPSLEAISMLTSLDANEAVVVVTNASGSHAYRTPVSALGSDALAAVGQLRAQTAGYSQGRSNWV